MNLKYISFVAVALLGLANAQEAVPIAAVETTAAKEELKPLVPYSAIKSFSVKSPDFNTWDERYPIPAVIGFALFGIAYVVTVAAIFWSIRQSKIDYDEMIQDDLNEMRKLGMDMKDIELELVEALKGKVQENMGDDQLLGEAMKLQRG